MLLQTIQCGRLMRPIILAAIAAGIAGASGCASALPRRPADTQPLAMRLDAPTSRPSDAAHADGLVVPDLPEDATLADYLAYALEHNPSLRAATQRWRAAAQVPAQARALPDPSLNLGYEQMYKRTIVGVSQMFPLWGKRELRGKAAEDGARAAGRQADAEQLAVLRRVASAYAEYVFVAQSEQVVQENLELVEQLEQVALARFRAAEAPHADVIRAQVEVGRVEDELRTVQERRPAAAARLNAALGRPADAALPAPRAMEAEDLELDEGQILGLVRRHNPELAAMEHGLIEARRRVALARREYYPDVMVGANYMRDRGADDAVGVMVSINLPIWRQRLRAGVREASAVFQAAVADHHEHINQTMAEAQSALFEYRDATRKAALFRDRLIPQAQEGLAATEAAYRAAAVPFSDLVEASRLLLEFELALARSQADQTQRLAELESLVGIPLRAGHTNPTTSEPTIHD